MVKAYLAIPSQMNGLYGRVAVRCGVHPSYVSRVARGERKSRKIEACLMREMLKLLLPAKLKVSKVKQRS